MATSIDKNAAGVEVINLFEATSAEEQTHVLNHLVDITEQVMVHLPGFISANLHRSIPSPLAPAEKFFVANYAQWDNPSSIGAMMQHPQAIAHMEEITTRFPRTGALFRLFSIYSPHRSNAALSKDVITVINLFEATSAEEQTHILNHLVDITEQVMVHLPGFISANLHRSIPSPLAPAEKFFVANYAQWDNPSSIGAMMQHPQAIAHMEEITTRFPRTGALFRLVSDFHPAQ